MRIHSMKVAERALAFLEENGFECIQVEEGTLGIGHWICLSHDDRYNVEISEVYLNCWSSGYTMRNFDKISKRIEALLA